MRSTLALSAAAGLISVASAHALESSLTARSSLPPGELWNKINGFCAMAAWDPAVERCDLSADGKQRTIVFFGGIGTAVATLENWDDAKRSYSWTNVSAPAPIRNHHARVSVIADSQTSALKLTTTYEAKGVSDAEAQKVMDSGVHRALCIGGPLLCSDDQRSLTPAEVVSFETRSVGSTPITLHGYLRRPDGAHPSPAVVLLHGCGGFPESLDQNWGLTIAAWGYVTLTFDRFGPRGLKNTCRGGVPLDMNFDVYQALNFLTKQQFVDPTRVFVVGFSQGGWLGLSSVERGPMELASQNKFRGAAAFYPPCLLIKGPMTVPTLILIGESDEWTPADACRKLVDGQDDLGVSRQKGGGPPARLIVYPDAYHAFDVPGFQPPIRYFGHLHAFDKTAADQSREALRAFLQSMVEGRR
jgi:dienelactone hydrolase